MAQQERERKRIEVLTLYAATGSAREAARKLEVPERTAQRWVAEAIEKGDELLADVGAKLRARAIDQASRMAVDALETARERGSNDAWCLNFKSDPGPAYLKLVTDTLKTLWSAEKLEAQRNGDIPPDAVEIRITRMAQDAAPEADD